MRDYWHQVDRGGLPHAVCGTARHIADELSGLRRLWRRNLRYLLDRDIREQGGTSIGALDYRMGYYGVADSDVPPMPWNVVRALTDSMVARITSNAMLPKVQTDGASETNQGKSREAERFGHSALRVAGWNALERRCVRLAAAMGSAFIKWYEADGAVQGVVVGPDRLLVDPMEDAPQRPSQAFHVDLVDRGLLLEMFDGETGAVAAIEAAKCVTSIDGARQSLEVFEAWKAGSEDRPGRHVIVLEDGVLLDEEWTRDVPVAVLRHRDALAGFHGDDFVSALIGPQQQINSVVLHVAENLEVLGHAYLSLGEGAVPAEVTDAGPFKVLPAGTSPVYPPIFNAQTLSWADRNEVAAQTLSGMSQASSMGLTPAGMVSGEAQRVHHALQTVRWSEVEACRQEFGVRCLEIVLDIGAAMEEWRLIDDEGGIRSLSWSDLDLKRESLHVRAVPASALAEDIGARAEQVGDMINRGWLPPDAAFRLLRSPDLEQYGKEQSAQRDAIEWVLEEMLEHGRYRDPSPMMDLQLCVKLGTAYWNRGLRAGVDPRTLALLERFVEAAVSILTPPPPIPQEPVPSGMDQQQAMLAADATQGPDGMVPSGPVPGDAQIDMLPQDAAIGEMLNG